MAKFNWKIAGKKLLINSVIVLGAGLASVYGDNELYLALAPLIMAIVNAVKHYK